MALCHNCDDVRSEYTGNGVQKEYLITFEYESTKPETIKVAFWNEETLLWEDNTDWEFKHETEIRFNEAPEYGQKFIIYRCTDLEPFPAIFTPGTAIKAKDLNENFDILKHAIEEAQCTVSRYNDKAEEKYWDKVDDTITYEDQTTGEAESKLDEEHIFDAEAIAARHDAYVQDSTPAALPYEQPGKIWNDTDDLRDYFWDSNVGTWVSFTKTGPAGPQGDFGPPGKVIISDSPPTEYPIVGDNDVRPLESGDMWFDSYRVIMYVYYVDNYGPGQWVAVSQPGPPGPEGPEGSDGEILSFVNPLVKTDTVVSFDLLTVPNLP